MSGRLRSRKDGGVDLDARAAERLAGRSYALLASPPELLVGVDEERDSPAGHALILAGDLARVAFPEVVSLIAHGRTSGLLRVFGPVATRTVVFAEGEVRGAASERLGERLGEVAVRMGLLKRDQMEALQREVHDPRRAGRLAVERGLLSERDLWNAAQEHVTTVFQAILLETRGSFVLTDERVEDALTLPGLSAEGLLMEGVRRLDELRVLRSGAGGHGAPARVLAAFNTAFRDIFATADGAGAGEPLRRAADSVFEDDPAHARLFSGLRFTPEGELPEAEVHQRLEADRESDLEPGERLSDVLSTVMLFLLFVAGEHLEPRVHQELHSRVKALVTRG